MTLERPADQDIVVFGASGDLAHRKLMPALYSLHLQKLLPAKGRIVGYGRKPLDAAEYKASVARSLREYSSTFDEPSWSGFAERLIYLQTTEGMGELRGDSMLPSRLIYLAIPPAAFEKTVLSLGAGRLVTGTTLVVEKPFGTDLASARKLLGTLHEVLDESQIFRIDHYLGKETVQNIAVFRFGNALFERIWNRDVISHIQITVAESIGVEERGSFYEEVGALRDIIQNHAFQVLALLTMEPPATLDPDAIRDEKVKLFCSLRVMSPEDVVRGQYTKGAINGEPVAGYRDEEGVSSNSDTETFVAARLHIDNWRWGEVPIYLRTGKRMPTRKTSIEIGFKEAPVRYFEEAGAGSMKPDHLTIEIQPDETITLSFMAKVPGPELHVKHVHMNFSYDEEFDQDPADAYERLLHDAMRGDATLFARADGVERAWQVVQPVLDDPPGVRLYPAGSWGPPEADALIAPRRWHLQ